MRILALVLAFTGLLATAALAVGDARFASANWPSNSTFEYGIYDKAGKRKATAYYRILSETSADGPAWRFKYSGKDDSMSESSECLVHRDTLQPIHSSRKVVYSGKTYFLDVTYRDGTVALKERNNEDQPTPMDIPTQGVFYDYEELIWLIPQLDFGSDMQVQFNLFNTIDKYTTTVLATEGEVEESLTVPTGGTTYAARTVSFNVGTVPYKFWLVMQDGQRIPARMDMGALSFLNLNLSAKKMTPFSVTTPSQ